MVLVLSLLGLIAIYGAIALLYATALGARGISAKLNRALLCYLLRTDSANRSGVG